MVSAPVMRVRGPRHKCHRTPGLLALALLASTLSITLYCAGSEQQPTTLDSIIPTFSSELDILGRQVRSVLEASAARGPQAGALRYEEAMEEISYEDDDGAQKAYATTMQFVSLRRDDLLANGCSAAEVSEVAEQKWTLHRLQKLHTLCVRASGGGGRVRAHVCVRPRGMPRVFVRTSATLPRCGAVVPASTCCCSNPVRGESPSI
jgi:hypothetical protein